jgi:hypothetical protein
MFGLSQKSVPENFLSVDVYVNIICKMFFMPMEADVEPSFLMGQSRPEINDVAVVD